MSTTRNITLTKASVIYGLVALFLVYEMALQVYPAVITEYLMRDLQLNAYGLGLMSGVYFYTYTIMQIPAGLLFDRLSIRTVIMLPLIICIAGTFLFCTATSPLVAGTARLLMGAGSAFAFISVLVVANDLFNAKHFALLAGIAQMLAAFGAIAGGLPLIQFINAYGWRQPLVIIGIIGLLLVSLIWLFVRYPKQIAAPEQKPNIGFSLKLLIRNPQTWYVAGYACLLWAPMSAFTSLWGVPFLIHYQHLSQTAAINANSFMWLGIALGSPLLGWWSDYINQRKLPLVCFALLGFVAFSVVIFIPDLSLTTIIAGLFFTGVACAGQALTFAVVRENNLPGTQAGAIGFNNMAVVIAGALFQPLIGKLIQLHSSGLIANGVPVYCENDYLFGISLLPFCLLTGALIALVLVQENLDNKI